MRPRARIPAACAAALLLEACGGGGGKGDPATGDAAIADAAIGTPADAAARDGAAADLRAPADVLPDRVAPAINAAAQRLVGPGARLIGTHTTACTHQDPPSGNGDRWCGFYRRGGAPGSVELWVLNVTQAAASPGIRCDGTDRNCRRLTATLWTSAPASGPAHPTAHEFDGDTLIFYADAPATQTLYRGPIYAWRPDWNEPRRLTGGNATNCAGHPRAEVAVCIENYSSSATAPAEFDLAAGRLADAPLKTVARIVPTRPGTTVGQWSSTFTRGGEHFVFSNGGRTVDERENLYVVRTADIGTPGAIKQVGAGLSRWDLSADGKKVFYLRDYNYAAGTAASGTLAVADFPSGTGEAVLAAGVGTYLAFSDPVGAEGIAFLQSTAPGRRTYRLVRDRERPDQIVDVAQDVAGLVLSPDRRYTYYNKQIDRDTGTADAYVARNDGGGSCALAMEMRSALFGPAFLRGAGLVFWVDNINPVTGAREGWYANPDRCAGRQRFSAAGIDFWFTARDEGLVFSETDGQSAALLYAPVGPGGLAAPVKVQDQVDRVYTLLPGFRGLVYSVNRGFAGSDGLYLWTGLPVSFQEPLAAAPLSDAGATRDARAD